MAGKIAIGGIVSRAIDMPGDTGSVRWRYRAVPDHLLGELLTKRWMDNAIPLLILLVVVAMFGSAIPDFLNAISIAIAG